ncbi:hypothetical protein PALB_28990 [Pseudoalteromonas luteoviolacea B = ATCC 29581]|nr:hypothetical protein PALB_28990 [Pseudoalteromonas luteoviolacea B = ATCC 29581]
MQPIKQIIFYALAVGAQKGFSFLLLPIATAQLTTAEYGELNFLTTISAVASLFLTFGQSELIFRFVNGKQNQSELLRFAFLVTLIGSSAFLCGAILWLPEYQTLLPLPVKSKDLIFLAINLALCPYIAILLSYFRLNERAKDYFYTAFLHAFSQTLFSICLLLQGYGTTGVMASGAFASFLVVLCIFIPLRRVFYRKSASQLTIKTTVKLKFSAFITASSLCLYTSNGLEQWFIAAKYNAESLAYYFIAAQFALIGSFLFEPVRMWWYAKRYQLVDNDQVRYQQLVMMCVSVTLVICLFMQLISPILITLMLPSDYVASIQYLPLLILALTFRFSSELLNIGCFIQKDGVYSFVANLIAAVFACLLLVYFVSGNSLFDIVYIVLAIQLARFILFYTLSQYLRPLQYPWKKVMPLWACIAIAQFNQQPTVLALLFFSGCVYLVFHARNVGLFFQTQTRT